LTNIASRAVISKEHFIKTPIMRRIDLRWEAPALFLLCLVGTAPAADGPAGADWPQWRGPTRDGHAAGEPWPGSLQDDHLKLAWRVDLEPSYSGPVVAGERVFSTETRQQKTEVVSAYHRRTGDLLWSTQWPGSMEVPFFAASNGSWIRATPACDGETLYVAGMCDVLVALDAATGGERWRVDFRQEFGTPLPSFGFVSSPIVWGEYIFVQAGGGFVKLDKRSGKVIWRTATDGGGMSGGAFSSPLIAEIAGRSVALVQTRSALVGIDPETGKELWNQPIKAFQGMNILTPTIHNDTIFTSAHSGRSQLWRLPQKESTHADSEGLKEIWSSASQAYMSSPVVVGDHLYLHLRNQRIACVDLNTGAETWRTTPFGKYQSLVAHGDRILALDQRGELLLLRADPTEFKSIDSRKISDEETWAHVAVCGGQVFVRELGGLAVFNWQ
jgi:outer membrane protein assembly factor BamB